VKIPFGKHEGMELADLPVSYLRWLAKQANLYGKLRIEVATTLEIPQVVEPQGMSDEGRRSFAWGKSARQLRHQSDDVKALRDIHEQKRRTNKEEEA